MRKLDAIGLTLGTLLALIVLIALAISLLHTPHSGPKILIAVWLWSLPVLGIGALAGWLVARLVCVVTASKGSTS